MLTLALLALAETPAPAVPPGERLTDTTVVPKLEAHAGLKTAVFGWVQGNNVPAHDTKNIYLDMRDNNATAVLTLVFEGFVHPVHGPQVDRTLTCTLSSAAWTCTDTAVKAP